MTTDKNQIPNTKQAAVTIKPPIERLNLTNTPTKTEKEIVTEEAETSITQKGADRNQNRRLILIVKKETKTPGEAQILKKKVVIKKALEARMMAENMFLKTKMVAVKRHTEIMVMMVIKTKTAPIQVKNQVKWIIKVVRKMLKSSRESIQM